MVAASAIALPSLLNPLLRCFCAGLLSPGLLASGT
jgi:hypothetical protein